MKIILGVDPGLERMGLGLISLHNNTIKYLHHTVLKTKSTASLEKRLSSLLEQLKKYMQEYKPHVVLIEEIFAGINRNTIIKLSMARTIPILCADEHNCELFHIPTRLIKQKITGCGAAEKTVVAKQVCNLLRIDHIENLDATDALACALYYLYL